MKQKYRRWRRNKNKKNNEQIRRKREGKRWWSEKGGEIMFDELQYITV